MKRLIKIISIIAVMVLSALSLFACGTPAGSSEKGLIVKQLRGKDTYAVVKYVDDGRESTVLDIEEEAKKLSQEKGKTIVISSILKEAFAGNDTLTEVKVPTTVEEIGEGAFAKMHCLEKLTVPFIGKNAKADTFINETASSTDKSVDKARTFGYFFGSESYEGATAITQQYILDEQEVTTDENGNPTSETIETSYTYYMPITLTTVTVAPKATETGYGVPMYAFAGNNLLEKVILDGKFRAIGNSAFENCSHITSISIPKDVTRIGDNAFYACTGIKEITFANDCALKVIGDSAFRATKLTSIILPSSVESIGDFCFAPTLVGGNNVETSTALVSVVLSEGLKTMGRYAFYKCDSLTTITLPTTLTAISDFAFAGCTKLETIAYAGDWSKLVKNPNWSLDASEFTVVNAL